MLRLLDVVAPRSVSVTPVDGELQRFDYYMERIRGHAPATRRTALAIVRELLWQRFQDRSVVISLIRPEHVRSCFARLSQR